MGHSDDEREAAGCDYSNFMVETGPPTGGSSPRSVRRCFAPLGPDSIRRRVAAGEVLITTLPARVDGRPVAAYKMLHTPARSNLAGRSFFWRTRSQDRGRHRLRFRARYDTTDAATDSTAAADTLAMVVTVE